MSATWSLVMEFSVSVGVSLTVAVVSILSVAKEGNMIKTIAKAVILTVGTALLGRPWTACFQLQRGEELVG